MNATDSVLPPAAPHAPEDPGGEPSPWLQRHWDGPVQWQPWGAAALATARALDRPLLLVMASEGCLPFEQMAADSFADTATAAVLNEGYVCCLADARWHRELDHQLQWVHQLLVGRAGGWPLLALIDPADGRPCFAGTYFPAAPTGPLPGFADFLQQALRHFRLQRVPLQAQGERLAKAFAQLVPPPLPESTPLTTAPLALVRRQLETLFDREAGTFTRGPAVPAAAAAQRLLRHWTAGAATPEPDLQALFMATLALTTVLKSAPTATLASATTTATTTTGGVGQGELAVVASELLALAAAAAGTGDPAFREGAEARFAWLAARGTPAAAPLPPAENWFRLQALAEAARWLDRADWTELALQQQASARQQGAAAPEASRATQAAALGATLAALELEWSATAFDFACAMADACCSPVPVRCLLPGLPPVPEHADTTLPATNGMAAKALYRLGCLCGNSRWQAAAAALLRAAWRPLNDAPATHLALLEALEEQTAGLETIVIRGAADEGRRWVRTLGRWYAPARQVFAIPAAEAQLPARLAALQPEAGANMAWLFTGEDAPKAAASLEQLTRDLRDRLHRH